MRFASICSRLASLSILAFATQLMSCHGSSEAPPANAASATPSAPAHPGATGNARITGGVFFRGPIPEAREPSAPFPECGQRTPQNPLEVKDGRVANVFVYVKDGLPPGDYPIPSEPVLLDQKSCDFHPRVFGIRAGQTLQMRNSDDVLHNVDARGNAGLSRGPNAFSVAMPIKDMTLTRKFAEAQVPVQIVCDVHPWMKSFAGVITNPFWAVTDENGAFSLNGLPAGSYTLEAWHERLGKLTAQVTVGANETRMVNLEFKP